MCSIVAGVAVPMVRDEAGEEKWIEDREDGSKKCQQNLMQVSERN
jgi:hypothetical protein